MGIKDIKSLTGTGTSSRSRLLRRSAVTATVTSALAVTALAGAAAHAATASRAAAPRAAAAGGYQFVTLGSHRDRTFNQLLGINNGGRIAAYFGSGNGGHPNKGYTMTAPYAQGDIAYEDFPGSRQTQVTGLNDHGVNVGFFSTMNKANPGDDNNFGFVHWGRNFRKVDFPTGDNAKPPVNQLLGVNNHNIAVGFYVNGQGETRGYEYNIAKNRFTRVTVPGAPGGTKAPNLTAAAINDHGDVAGFYNASANKVDGFVKLANGDFVPVIVPGAASTQLLGINNSDVAVGFYTDAAGDSFGFIFNLHNGRYTTNVNPAGNAATVLNGINNEGDIVGFFTDAAGNTDGLLGFPAF